MAVLLPSLTDRFAGPAVSTFFTEAAEERASSRARELWLDGSALAESDCVLKIWGCIEMLLDKSGVSIARRVAQTYVSRFVDL